jgi:hypothetical protein
MRAVVEKAMVVVIRMANPMVRQPEQEREAIYCVGTIAMLNGFLRLLIRCLLWLRYRIRVRGLDRIASPTGAGCCFWPTTRRSSIPSW